MAITKKEAEAEELKVVDLRLAMFNRYHYKDYTYFAATNDGTPKVYRVPENMAHELLSIEDASTGIPVFRNVKDTSKRNVESSLRQNLTPDDPNEEPLEILGGFSETPEQRSAGVEV